MNLKFLCFARRITDYILCYFQMFLFEKRGRKQTHIMFFFNAFAPLLEVQQWLPALQGEVLELDQASPHAPRKVEELD